MDPLLANSYFMHLNNYSNPLYSASLITSDAGMSTNYYTTMDSCLNPKVPDYSDESNNSSPPEPTALEPVKTDLRKVRRKGTNLYGRPYCPGRPLSMEERTRIIELHMNGMKVNAISKSLCISHGCVSKIISRYRSTGILTPASSPEQRRTRRIKKTDSSPESVSTQESYVSLDYSTAIPIQFLNASPSQHLQPGSSQFHPVHLPSYGSLQSQDQMMLQEYQILL